MTEAEVLAEALHADAMVCGHDPEALIAALAARGYVLQPAPSAEAEELRRRAIVEIVEEADREGADADGIADALLDEVDRWVLQPASDARLREAAKDVLAELDIIRAHKDQPRYPGLMVHIDTHAALRAALSVVAREEGQK